MNAAIIAIRRNIRLILFLALGSLLFVSSAFAQDDGLLPAILEQSKMEGYLHTIDDKTVVAVTSKALANRKKLAAETVLQLLYARAQANLALKDFESARKDADEVCAKRPDDAEARYLRSYVLLELDLLKDAWADAEAAVKLRPRSAKMHNMLAILLMAKGRLESACEVLERSGKLDPGFAWNYFALAEIMCDRDPSLCLEAINKYFELCPGVLGPMAARGYYMKGFSLSLLNRHRESLACFVAAQKIEPKNVRTNEELALAYLELEKYQLAARQAENCVALDPRRPAGYSYSAMAYSKIGNTAKAKAMVEKAVALSENDQSFLCSLGDIHGCIGDFDAALKYYDKAIARSPGHFLATVKKASLLATCPDPLLRDGRKAVKLAESALSAERTRDWQKWRPLMALAEARAECGDFAKAAELARSAIMRAGSEFGHRELFMEKAALFEKKMPYRLKSAK
ncbi:MAG TPA: tetratricopeptide repeat protein [Gemmataceae bacterium]|nr:tetratricopeptide repeat protein [Gemmataceae bacterium]